MQHEIKEQEEMWRSVKEDLRLSKKAKPDDGAGAIGSVQNDLDSVKNTKDKTDKTVETVTGMINKMGAVFFVITVTCFLCIVHMGLVLSWICCIANSAHQDYKTKNKIEGGGCC